MANASTTNIIVVHLLTSSTLRFSLINTYPTKTLAPMANPMSKIKNKPRLKFLTKRKVIPAIRCKKFPNKATFLLPYISLTLGNMKDEMTTPAKKIEPKSPKYVFGAHVKSNFSTQLERLVSEDVSTL